MNVAPMFRAVERILLTLWIGGLWVTGLVLAPVLFANFDRQLAGDIAGRLFTAISWIGLICGPVLLLFSAQRSGRNFWRDWQVIALLLMLVILLVGEYGIAARMRELKALAILEDKPAGLWAEFGRLHAVSSTLYLIECLLGLAVVVFGNRAASQAGS